MPTRMSLTAVGAASQILASATSLLDSIREQAKSSKDMTLKENIGKLYDMLNDLKEAVNRVTDENAELQRKFAGQAPNCRPTARTGNQAGGSSQLLLCR